MRGRLFEACLSLPIPDPVLSRASIGWLGGGKQGLEVIGNREIEMLESVASGVDNNNLEPLNPGLNKL